MNLSRNLLANYIGQFWRAVMAFAFIPIYIKLIGIESYGLIGFFAIFQSSLALFDMGMKPAVARETAKISENHDDESSHRVRNLLRSVELISIMIVLTLILVMFLSSSWIAINWLQSEFLDYEIIRKSIIIFAGISCLQFLESIYTSCLSGLQRQVRLNVLISGFATLKGVGAVFVLSFISPTIIAFFLWQLAVAIISLIVISYSLYSVLPRSNQATKFSLIEIQKIWKFAFGMLGITFVALMLTQLDKVLLSNILPLSDFGYYSLVGAVVAGLYFFVTPVTAAYFPKFVALIESKEQLLLKNAYHQSAELVAVLMGVTGVFLAFHAYSILLLWTQDPEIVNNTYYLLSILSISTIFNGVLWIPMQMQLAHGVTSITLKVAIVTMILTVPLFFILTPVYQSVGAAFITLGMNIFALAANLIFMNRSIMKGQNFTLLIRHTIFPLIVAFVTCCLLNWLIPKFESLSMEFFRLIAIFIPMLCFSLLSTLHLKNKCIHLFNQYLKN
jgi:O-antigen/teichoic acid export membrane protein